MAGGAAAATKLTPANSISVPFAANTSEQFSGTGCGTSAVVTRQIPGGSTGIRIVAPKVGDRDPAGHTRISAVALVGTAVTLTAVADGPGICDPAQSGSPPGPPVDWKVAHAFRAEYTRRVQATIRVYFESYIFGAKWKIRPRTIRDHRRGGGPGERLTGIRWKQFGGKKAIGSGRLRQDFCRRGENCPQNGRRVRIVATKPKYCKDSDKIEYRDLAVYIGRRQWAAYRITCSR